MTARVGWVHVERGTLPDGIRRLREVIALLTESAASSALAALYAALAALLFEGGRYGEQLAAAEEAGCHARLAGDDKTLAHVGWVQGLALFHLGRVDEGLAVLREAALVAERVGEGESLACTLMIAGGAHLDGGELAASGSYVERALDVARSLGDPAAIAYLTAQRGEIAYVGGEWARAAVDFEAAAAVSEGVGISYASVYIQLNLGRLYLGRGDWDEAAHHLAAGLTMAERNGNMRALCWAHALQAEWEARTGRPAAAIARLTPLLAQPSLEEWDGNVMLPALAAAHLAAGDIAVAAALAARACGRLRGGNQRLSYVEALRVLAAAALGRRDEAAVTAALEEGLTVARRMPCPLAEARLLLVSGEWRQSRGQDGPACAELAAALDIFRRLGACADIASTERLLPRLAPPAGLAPCS